MTEAFWPHDYGPETQQWIYDHRAPQHHISGTADPVTKALSMQCVCGATHHGELPRRPIIGSHQEMT